jgi:hypothetical protein
VSNPTAQGLFSNVKIYESATASMPVATRIADALPIAAAPSTATTRFVSLMNGADLGAFIGSVATAGESAWRGIPGQLQPHRGTSSAIADGRVPQRSVARTASTLAATQVALRARPSQGAVLDGLADGDNKWELRPEITSG